MASGTPVIAFKAGGVLDYLVENKNAIFFNKQTSTSLNKAIIKFEKNKIQFDPKNLRNSVLKFSDKSFIYEFKKIVNKNFNNEY